LLSIIEHDVRRLDRLISDISDASRLDAELARDEVNLVDLTRLSRYGCRCGEPGQGAGRDPGRTRHRSPCNAEDSHDRLS
jgi:hypothetical protein